VTDAAMWGQLDEQALPVDLRMRLSENGLRAGVAGSQLPVELQRVLELDERNDAAGAASGEATGDGAERKADRATLAGESRVRVRHLPLRAEAHGEIQASGVIESLPLLINEDGVVRGEPYAQAQVGFSARAKLLEDARVRLELIPEVQHGESRQRFAPTDGGFVLEAGRSKRTFDDLKIELDLAAGQSLVLCGVPYRDGGLGRYALSDDRAGVREQKVLIIRLVQTQHDGAFTGDAAAKPEVGDGETRSARRTKN
jgi:hypothetical protein